MKVRIVLIFPFILLLLNSCSLFKKQPLLLDTSDTLAIRSAICSHYKNAHNIEIAEEYLSYITLCWNDPAGKPSQAINVNSDCWKISFEHRVYDTDGIYLYTDFYNLYLPQNDSLAFIENRFHGRHYHGNTCVMIKGAGDTRYPNTPFVRSKDNYIRVIESILLKE